MNTIPNQTTKACRVFAANLTARGYSDCPIGDIDDDALEAAILAALQSPTDREGDRLLRRAARFMKGPTADRFRVAEDFRDAEQDYLALVSEIDAHLSRSIVGEGE